jgi:hypothetical protein
VTGESYDASPDRDDLGELLVLLHGADVPANTIQVTYRVWRHQERVHAAFRANAEEQQRRGASTRTFSLGRGTPQPTEIEETVRIWRDGNRARVEYHGGARDGYYAVADGPLWWMWDERNGAHSNQDDPSVGGGVGEELQIMGNPTPLLSSLRFGPTGSSEVAGRPTITAHGIHLAARHPGRVRSLSLHSGWPASDDYLNIVVEQWRTLATALPTIADVVIQGIFPWCFTPEMYVERPEFVDTLVDFVRGRPGNPWTRS